MHVTVTVINNR